MEVPKEGTVMKFRLFDYLYYAIPKDTRQTLERQIFDAHSHILSNYESTKAYLDCESGFDFICADIVILALLNKAKIESFAEMFVSAHPGPRALDAIHRDLPCFDWQGKPIYVPIFNPQINTRYASNLQALAVNPFEALRRGIGLDAFYVTPFVEYAPAIFDSRFTSLLKIERQDNVTVFYSYSFETVYLISDEGTLEATIPLFDRDLSDPDRFDIPKRIQALMVPYFAFDKPGFIQALYDNRFISEDLLERIRKYEGKNASPKGPKGGRLSSRNW